MEPNEWMGLVDKIATQLGVASNEVVQAVEVLTRDYQMSCLIGVGLALTVGIIGSIISWKVRRSAEILAKRFTNREYEEESFIGATRIFARIGEGIVWLLAFIPLCTNLIALPIARLKVLQILFSSLR